MIIMIKKCKILNYNRYQGLIVVKFGDIQVQFPCDEDIIGNECYVKDLRNGLFVLSSEEEFVKENSKKRSSKVKNDIVEIDESNVK